MPTRRRSARSWEFVSVMPNMNRTPSWLERGMNDQSSRPAPRAVRRRWHTECAYYRDRLDQLGRGQSHVQQRERLSQAIQLRPPFDDEATGLVEAAGVGVLL